MNYSYCKLGLNFGVVIKETARAAGFALIEPYILSFIEKVNGSFTGFSHGLPMELLIPLLKKYGFEPSPRKIVIQ